MRRAVSFERPHFHFSKTLAAELRLPSQRLLGDQGVRSDRSCVNLVVHQVRQLEHVDDPDRYLLVEFHSCPPVDKHRPGAFVQPGFVELSLDILPGRPVKYRRCKLDAELPRRPPESRLIELPQVHAGGDAERVQDDIHRCPVREERHVPHRDDARDDPLVPVPARHLVADGEFAFLGHVHLRQLNDAGGKFIAELDLVLLVAELLLDTRQLVEVIREDPVDEPVLPLVVHPFRGEVEFLKVLVRVECLGAELGPGAEGHVPVLVPHADGLLVLEQNSELPREPLPQVDDDFPPLPVERVTPAFVFLL